LKFLVLCAIFAAALSAGCAYTAGEKEVVVGKIYDSEPELRARDVSAARAEWGVIALVVEQYYTKGSPCRESLQKVREYVPYHAGHAMGNLGQGMISICLVPISLPVFALSGMPAEVYWEHLNTILHNLDVIRANPPDEAYAFRTPVKARTLGEVVYSEQKTLEDDVIIPLSNSDVSVEIDEPRIKYSGTVTTDEKGELVINLKEKVKGIELPPGKEIRIRLRHGGKETVVEVALFLERD